MTVAAGSRSKSVSRRARTFSLLARRSDSSRELGANPDDVFGEAKTCPVIAYGSSHLLRLPWMTLDQGRARTLRRRSFQVERADGSRGPLQSYEMTGGVLGLPGPFEGSVFHALEAMAIEESRLAGREIRNPIIFSLRQVCERLCLKEVVRWFKAVEIAIRVLSEVRIEGPQEPILPSPWGPRIRLAEPLLFRTRLGDRDAASFRHVIQLDPGHVASLNRGLVRAMNWAVWVALRNPVARRILEILDPLPEAGPVGIPLGTLGRLLAASGETTLPRMKRLLTPAHEELIKERYLDRVEWLPGESGGEPRYHPGPAWRALSARLRTRDVRLGVLPTPPVLGRASLA